MRTVIGKLKKQIEADESEDADLNKQLESFRDRAKSHKVEIKSNQMSNQVSSSRVSSMSKTANIAIAADSAQDVSEQMPQPAVASQPSACGDEKSSVETLKSDGSDAMILNAAQDSVSNDVTAAVGDNVQVEDESVSDDGSDDVFEPTIVNNEQADEDPSQERQLSVLSSDSSDCTVLLNAMIEARTTCES